MRDTCAICGSRIDPKPVDGTDPKDAEDSWYEIYRCENGHKGLYHVIEPQEGNGWERSETTLGCLRSEPQEMVL